jgi:hypothetical protein
MAIQKIPNTLIADNAITATKIANGTLTADDIAANSITAAKLSASTSPTFGGLTVDGDVGIGTTSPNTTLTLSDGTDEFDFGVTANQLLIKSVTSDGSDDQRIIIDAGNGGLSSTRGAYIALSGNEASAEPGHAIYQMGNVTGSAHVFRKAGGSDAVTIDSSGNVQIVDGGKLVTKTTSGEVIRFERASDSNRYSSIHANSTDAGGAFIQFKVHTGATATSLADVMTLKGDGNVGIGRTDPTQLLEVHKNAGGDQTVAKFSAHNYGDTGKTFIEIGTEYGDGSSRIGSFNDTGNKSVLVFDVHSATSGQFSEKMRIKSDGQITTQGDILPGADVIMANGRGISFAATANSSGSMSNELLDDYEEGTWTPSCGATLSTASGQYTKIGNQVTVHYHIVSTGGLPSSTGQVQIYGLPFTSNSGSLTAGPIYARYYTPNDSTLTSLVQDNETQIRLINTNDQNFDYTIWGELEATGNNSIYIIGSVTYIV